MADDNPLEHIQTKGPADIKPLSMNQIMQQLEGDPDVGLTELDGSPRKRPPPPEKPQEPAQAKQPEPEPETKAEAEMPAEEQQEAQAATEAQAEAESEGEEGEGEAPRISTLEELAEHLQVDPQAFNDWRVPVKVGDERQHVKLADLMEKYRAEEVANQRAQKLSEQRQQFEAEQQQQVQQWQQRLSTAAQLTQKAKEQLHQEMSQVDWRQLEQEEPGQAALMRQRYEQRLKELEGVEREVQSQAEQQQREAVARYQEQLQQYRARENERLLDHLPQWADEQTASRERSEIIDYLRNKGFQDTELAQLFDHRTLLVARDAMHFANMQNKATAAKKKVSALPKRVIKSGAVESKQQGAERAWQQGMDRVKKTGRLEDAAALLEQFIE